MAMKYRFLAILMIVPISLLITHFLKKPQLFPGDKLDYRTCRECDGTGSIPEAPRCPGCGGKKQQAVITPGPNRPSKVRGIVYDARTGDYLEAAMDPMQAAKGAITGAHVVLEKDGQKVEVDSNAKGRFTVVLAPGTWKLTSTADGYQTAGGTYEVPVLTQPIVINDARIRVPGEDPEEPCVIGMTR